MSKPRYYISGILGWAYEIENPNNYVTFFKDGTASRHIYSIDPRGKQHMAVSFIGKAEWNEQQYQAFIVNEVGR